jgi:protease PrsW
MGYYLAKGKFSVDIKHTIWIFLSFFVPFLFHGVYDFILVSFKNWIYCMIPFMLFLWWYGLRKVKNARILSAKYHEKALEE